MGKLMMPRVPPRYRMLYSHDALKSAEDDRMLFRLPDR
jgi:hypothetical protein